MHSPRLSLANGLFTGVQHSVSLAMMKALVSTALRLAIWLIMWAEVKQVHGVFIISVQLSQHNILKCLTPFCATGRHFLLFVLQNYGTCSNVTTSDSQFYHKLLTIACCLTIYMREKLFWNTPCSDIPKLISPLSGDHNPGRPCGYLGRLCLHLLARTQVSFKGYG